MTLWYDGNLFEAGSVGSVDERSPHLPPHLPLDNAGLRFGATVFTTLRVYQQNLSHPLTQWQAHCDRLTYSIQQFQWSPPEWSAVRSGAQQLMVHYPILRITIFPDGREWITGRSLPNQLSVHQENGVACWVAPPTYSRSLPTHKTGNYLACWLARQQAQRHGAHDAILTNAQGDWLETTSGNLWGWKSGNPDPSKPDSSKPDSSHSEKSHSEKSHSEKSGWHTPIHDYCLPGVMRSLLEKRLGESGQRVSHEPWSLQRLLSFEALAYSNCAVGLVPIHTILNGAVTLEYNPYHASLKALQQLAQTSTGFDERT